jgi:hypothetical protein
MTRFSWRHPHQLGGFLALLTAGSILTVLGGLTGAVFGIAAAIAWVAGPPVFAFVLAQAGLAALVSPPYSLLVALAELLLLVVLLSDPRVPWTGWSHTLAVSAVAVLVGLGWLLQSLSLWGLAVGTVVMLAVFIYAVHRYELLVTHQLHT